MKKRHAKKLMKTILVLAIVLLAGAFRGMKAEAANVKISEANFPDQGLRKSVQSHDQNGDGYLSSEEIEMVESLHVSGKKLVSLQGLQYFKNLKDFTYSCYPKAKGDIRILKFPSGMKLERINIRGISSAITIDVSACKELTSLDINNCKNVKEIKLGNIQKVDSMHLMGCENLEKLDVSKQKNLDYLALLEFKKLKRLDVSKNTKLRTLIIMHTPISSINLKNNKKLEGINISNNKSIKKIDVSKCTRLKGINLTECPRLTTYKLGKIKKLESFFFYECN